MKMRIQKGSRAYLWWVTYTIKYKSSRRVETKAFSVNSGDNGEWRALALHHSNRWRIYVNKNKVKWNSLSLSPVAAKKFLLTARKAITVTTENQLIAHHGGKSAEINIIWRGRCRWEGGDGAGGGWEDGRRRRCSGHHMCSLNRLASNSEKKG